MDRRFNTRGFTTFLVTLLSLIILVTGAILYITPRGRTANWTGWTVLGLDKHQWGALHITTAALFLILAGIHLYFNWKVLLQYFRARASERMSNRRELTAALAIGVVLVGGTLGGLPPFSTLIGLNQDIKAYWERTGANPPVAHAEDLDLAGFARTVDMPLSDVVTRLRDKGFSVPDPTVSVAVLASVNGVVPSTLHEAVRPDASGHGGAMGQHRGGGRGWGRLTLGQLCEQKGIDAVATVAKLKERGVEASKAVTLRDLAGAMGVNPGEVARMIEQMR